MKGLLLNNYYSMQDNIKMSAVILAFLCVAVAIIGKSMLSMAISVSIFIFPVNIGSSLLADETSKWNKFEITMPVSRRDIVKCKYLSYLILVIIGMISSIAILLILVISGQKIDMQQLGFSYLFGLSLAMFTGAFLYPLLLKLGALKSELLIIISAMFSLVCIIGVSLGVGIVMAGSFGAANINAPQVSVGSFIISVICFVVSYFISVRIHGNKEF